jgi:hypothetical protein
MLANLRFFMKTGKRAAQMEALATVKTMTTSTMKNVPPSMPSVSKRPTATTVCPPIATLPRTVSLL